MSWLTHHNGHVFPSDYRLLIVYAAKSLGFTDRTTIRSLLRLCRASYMFMKQHWALIVEHYTNIATGRGCTTYTFCGLFHRDNDLPAVIWTNGIQQWHQYGLLHRDNDQPAIIRISGTREWYKHGELHRDSGQPAVIRADGTCEWHYKNKQYYSTGVPLLYTSDDSVHLLINGKYALSVNIFVSLFVPIGLVVGWATANLLWNTGRRIIEYLSDR